MPASICDVCMPSSRLQFQPEISSAGPDYCVSGASPGETGLLATNISPDPLASTPSLLLPTTPEPPRKMLVMKGRTRREPIEEAVLYFSPHLSFGTR